MAVKMSYRFSDLRSNLTQLRIGEEFVGQNSVQSAGVRVVTSDQEVL